MRFQGLGQGRRGAHVIQILIVFRWKEGWARQVGWNKITDNFLQLQFIFPLYINKHLTYIRVFQPRWQHLRRKCTWRSRSYRRHLALWQEITQLGQFCRWYLGHWRNMWELVSCDIHRYISLFQAKKTKIILGDLEAVFGGVESSLDSSSAFLKLSSSLSKLSLRTESHF